MSLRAGIVGLPNVGKSTLFKTLTKLQVEIANYPFATIQPNVGVVEVPDVRLEQLVQVARPSKFYRPFLNLLILRVWLKELVKAKGLATNFWVIFGKLMRLSMWSDVLPIQRYSRC